MPPLFTCCRLHLDRAQRLPWAVGLALRFCSGGPQTASQPSAPVHVVIPLVLTKGRTEARMNLPLRRRTCFFAIRLRRESILAHHPFWAVIQRSAATKDLSSIVSMPRRQHALRLLQLEGRGFGRRVLSAAEFTVSRPTVAMLLLIRPWRHVHPQRPILLNPLESLRLFR